MIERSGLVTFHGNGLTLEGTSVEPGDAAPDFSVLTNDLQTKTLADYKGKVVLLVTVPSIDTPVCDVEARRFNQEAADLHEDIEVLTVSTDLPFAQARWCGAAGINSVEVLSDHKDLSLGHAYGVAIKELRLLARAVFVIDRNHKVTYTEIVPEVTNEPNYEAVIKAAEAAL
ncbi:thiol peroxidase [Halodesulfovibrio sp.]|jgi:thiol peroxidase|uniref:thiol peroxidase n=1 Tax=Halodesulfovibrio sp. TaxID=1912772 RepID=UPI0025E3B9EB|nr:thiol peroxidase [Halodesulfovibrio sp.]MCT4536252.1 thiol peroxidase [Halodesulfovibrio sp.]MCT4626896.1 thiol peroxidase [Halodesulfovibrio sp.]